LCLRAIVEMQENDITWPLVIGLVESMHRDP
jgi:hypothetical protein